MRGARGVWSDRLGDVSSPRRGRVLVIDDEPAICALVDRMLRPEHDVVTTTYPEQAVQMIREGQRFDLIISDVMMPVMNGIETHAAVASIDAEQGERFVFFTASVLSPDLERRLESLPNTILRKPVSVSAMRQFVRGRIV
jgi:CheY-like chemotaxis protein